MTTIRMPELGESVVEGTVGKWLVSEGANVEKDQPVVEILTDKADSELPAPEAGVLTRILVREGEVVRVGAPLFEIEAGANGAAQVAEAKRSKKTSRAGAKPTGASAPAPGPAVATAAGATPSSAVLAPSGAVADVPASPSLRRLAREHGVDLAALGTRGGAARVTREDVLDAIRRPDARTGAGGATVSSGAFRPPPYVPKPGDEVIPFSRRRRIIADHMVYSKLTAPHVVTFAECDLHATAKLRDAHKNEGKRDGVNLTFLAFVAQATARALREFRAMNARVLDDAHVLLGEIHLGIAVDTDEGLVVPVVRHADDLTVKGLARAIDELALKAREGRLAPDDLAGKTFTISNPGRKGNLVGGAIISQPNVGILRTGEIKKRVVVVEHDGEDLMAIHPVMHVALSYDHRVVDGVAANGFLHRVVELLEAAEFTI